MTDLLLFLGSTLLLEQRLLLPLFFLALAFFGGGSSLRVSLRLLRLKLALILSLLCGLLLLLLRLNLAVPSHRLTAIRLISGTRYWLTRRVLLLLRGGARYNSLTRCVLRRRYALILLLLLLLLLLHTPGLLLVADHLCPVNDGCTRLGLLGVMGGILWVSSLDSGQLARNLRLVR